jgi:hypothetical protein
MPNTLNENIWNCLSVGDPIYFVDIKLKALSNSVLTRIVETLENAPAENYEYCVESVEYTSEAKQDDSDTPC